MTVSEFVDADEFVEVDNSALMSTVCRGLEAVGLRVVGERYAPERHPVARATSGPALVLVGGKALGRQDAHSVTFRQGAGTRAPVVVVAMYVDEEAALAAMGADRWGGTSTADGLTPREVQVLEALANGASTSQVAHMLFISRKTVKNHLAHIYAKLGASSRTQAVATAVRLGIVQIA